MIIIYIRNVSKIYDDNIFHMYNYFGIPEYLGAIYTCGKNLFASLKKMK